MNSPLLGASDFDLDALDAFLMSDRAPEDCMQLSDLDGFLAGIAIRPELIMPSEWVPVIWGGGEPEFESMEEAQRILNAIMGRYNEILHLLQHAPDEFEPIFWTTKDGEAVAADWAEGFMEAVELRPSAWEALLASEEDRQLLAPIVAHLHDEGGDPSSSTAFGRPGAKRQDARPSQVATIRARAARAGNTSGAAAPIRLADRFRKRGHHSADESLLLAP